MDPESCDLHERGSRSRNDHGGRHKGAQCRVSNIPVGRKATSSQSPGCILGLMLEINQDKRSFFQLCLLGVFSAASFVFCQTAVSSLARQITQPRAPGQRHLQNQNQDGSRKRRVGTSPGAPRGGRGRISPRTRSVWTDSAGTDRSVMSGLNQRQKEGQRSRSPCRPGRRAGVLPAAPRWPSAACWG